MQTKYCVEEFGLDLSAFVNVSTTIDEPAIYLGLFTDRDHGIYSSDIGPSEFFIPTRDTDPTKFYIPHRTIQNFLNGKVESHMASYVVTYVS